MGGVCSLLGKEGTVSIFYLKINVESNVNLAKNRILFIARLNGLLFDETSLLRYCATQFL